MSEITENAANPIIDRLAKLLILDDHVAKKTELLTLPTGRNKGRELVGEFQAELHKTIVEINEYLTSKKKAPIEVHDVHNGLLINNYFGSMSALISWSFETYDSREASTLAIKFYKGFVTPAALNSGDAARRFQFEFPVYTIAVDDDLNYVWKTGDTIITNKQIAESIFAWLFDEYEKTLK